MTATMTDADYTQRFRDAVAARNTAMISAIAEITVPTMVWLGLIGTLKQEDPKGFAWLIAVLKDVQTSGN